MKPTDNWRTLSATVRVNADLPRSACQALEYDYALADSGADDPWLPCQLPPFGIIAEGPMSAVVCWRHLYALGDTGRFKVTPYIRREFQVALERASVGTPIVKLPEGDER